MRSEEVSRSLSAHHTNPLPSSLASGFLLTLRLDSTAPLWPPAPGRFPVHQDSSYPMCAQKAEPQGPRQERSVIQTWRWSAHERCPTHLLRAEPPSPDMILRGVLLRPWRPNPRRPWHHPSQLPSTCPCLHACHCRRSGRCSRCSRRRHHAHRPSKSSTPTRRATSYQSRTQP